MTLVRRKFLKVALAAIAAGGSTACFGSFPAIRWVYSFNKEISGSKLIQWLVFLVLTAIPVYGVAALIDVWILNSLEFWFGGSSTAEKETDEKTVELGPGETLHMRKDHNAGTLHMHYRGKDKDVALLLEMNEKQARLVDADGREVMRAREIAGGGLEVHAGGLVIDRFEASDVQDAVRSYEEGGADATAAWAARRVETTNTVARR